MPQDECRRMNAAGWMPGGLNTVNRMWIGCEMIRYGKIEFSIYYIFIIYLIWKIRSKRIDFNRQCRNAAMNECRVVLRHLAKTLDVLPSHHLDESVSIYGYQSWHRSKLDILMAVTWPGAILGCQPRQQLPCCWWSPSSWALAILAIMTPGRYLSDMGAWGCASKP